MEKVELIKKLKEIENLFDGCYRQEKMIIQLQLDDLIKVMRAWDKQRSSLHEVNGKD
jgi:hypothetical protein